MKNKNLKKISKVILIGGIILCGIAQILPWGRLELGITEEIQEEFPVDDFANVSINIYFYHWGGLHLTPKFPGVQEWYLTPTDFSSGITGSPKVYGFAFGTLFLYFIIPLALISLVTGIAAYKKVERKRSKNSLHAGVSSIMAVLFFIVFMQLAYLSNIEEIEGFSASYYWYSGFYLMIGSAILFFIVLAIISRIYSEKKDTKTAEKTSESKGSVKDEK
ncbi:MAG: hypothetical protein JSW60_02030 [Thermoplasmatales archaeon]|nr:MAG: hypothetical protein JSW60_02030 [Thermoplasmatales archaeon]